MTVPYSMPQPLRSKPQPTSLPYAFVRREECRKEYPMKWEHTEETVNMETETMAQAMNRMGSDRWEFCHARYQVPGYAVLVFKRPQLGQASSHDHPSYETRDDD